MTKPTTPGEFEDIVDSYTAHLAGLELYQDAKAAIVAAHKRELVAEMKAAQMVVKTTHDSIAIEYMAARIQQLQQEETK